MINKKENDKKYAERLKQRAALIHGDKCRRCGRQDDDLEYAHINSNGLSGHSRGLTRRYRDIIHNRKDYVRLCKDCHRQLDLGEQ